LAHIVITGRYIRILMSRVVVVVWGGVVWGIKDRSPRWASAVRNGDTQCI